MLDTAVRNCGYLTSSCRRPGSPGPSGRRVAAGQRAGDDRDNYLGTVHVCDVLCPPRRAGRLHHRDDVLDGGTDGVVFSGYAGDSASKFAVAGFSEVLRGELWLHGVDVVMLWASSSATTGFDEENRT